MKTDKHFNDGTISNNINHILVHRKKSILFTRGDKKNGLVDLYMCIIYQIIKTICYLIKWLLQ